MNILLCHKDIIPGKSSGGFSNAYCHLAERYADLGHRVVMLTKRDCETEYDYRNITIVKGDSNNVEYFEKLLKHYEIDIIEVPSWNHELFEYSMRMRTVPMVTRVDFSARYFLQPASEVTKEESMVLNSDGLIAISEWVRKEWGSVTGKSIPIIPYGVSQRAEKNVNREKKVVWVGKATWMKGIDFLPQIVDELSANGFQLQLIVTPISNNYQDNVSLECLKKKGVEILSNLSEDEYDEIMNKATFILSTARKEGFCIAVLEGMANGLIPVIPDWVGGTLDFVNDDNGIIFSSISNIPKALCACSTTEKSKKALKTTYEYTWDYCAKQSLLVYEETIQKWANRNF